jgi:hypothetical protein
MGSPESDPFNMIVDPKVIDINNKHKQLEKQTAIMVSFILPPCGT